MGKEGGQKKDQPTPTRRGGFIAHGKTKNPGTNWGKKERTGREKKGLGNLADEQEGGGERKEDRKTRGSISNMEKLLCQFKPGEKRRSWGVRLPGLTRNDPS